MEASSEKDIGYLLLNEQCMSVTGGVGAGSVVCFGFGELVKRDVPLKNKTLTRIERNYNFEKSLMVFCAWRLRDGNKIKLGWRDSNSEKTWMSLKSIVGHRVTNVEIDPTTYDLKLTFDNSFVFELFCEVTNNAESDENYYLQHSGKYLTIGISSTFQITALLEKWEFPGSAHIGCDRNAGCPAPLAQIPACATNAPAPCLEFWHQSEPGGTGVAQ